MTENKPWTHVKSGCVKAINSVLCPQTWQNCNFESRSASIFVWTEWFIFTPSNNSHKNIFRSAGRAWSGYLSSLAQSTHHYSDTLFQISGVFEALTVVWKRRLILILFYKNYWTDWLINIYFVLFFFRVQHVQESAEGDPTLCSEVHRQRKRLQPGAGH